MNMLKKGPEIKMPELKVPEPILNVFYDLRERHLLPLVAVLAVAIAAVPIALSQSSGSGNVPPNGVTAVGVSSATPDRSGELVVAKTAQGLHSYHHRLGYLRATDPFKQQFTKPETNTSSASSAGAESSASSAGAESSVSESSTGSASGPVTSSPPTIAESTHITHQLTFYSYAIDVRMVTGNSKSKKGSAKKSEPQVRRNLPELTTLPSRKKPAAIFMGVTKDGQKALLLISSNVTAIFGEDRCVLGSQTCQLLALEPGAPETLVYGPKHRTVKIELLKTHLVVTNKLHRASIGGKRHGH
jgi:hypothetical protein